MGGAMSRNKGARGEREVKELCRAHGYPHARRYLAGDGLQPGDIDRGPAGWVLEVKWWGDVTAAVREGLRQAHHEAVQCERPYPMVAVRLEGGPSRWVAVFTSDTWIHCAAFGAPERLHHVGTMTARLALTLHTGGLCDIGKGLMAMPLPAWLDTLKGNE